MKTDLRSLTFAVLAAPLLALGQATISTVAGTGTSGFSGDGGPAMSARISASASFGVAADNAGNFDICDGGNNRIRKVNAAGVISTVAGGGSAIGGGDGAGRECTAFPRQRCRGRGGTFTLRKALPFAK